MASSGGCRCGQVGRVQRTAVKLSAAEIAKLDVGVPWTQPGFNTTDVYLSGAQSQTKVNTTGIHHGPPPKEPLGNTTLS